MAIAYFIMVHHKPRQLEWLLRAIDHPDDLILVHVDLKSRLGLKADRRGVMRGVRHLVAERPNAVLLPSRMTNWGGWSLSQALLDGISAALLHDRDWTHFVNLSGQCYPLQPLAQLRDAIAASTDVHVELQPIAGLDASDWHSRAIPMIETPVRALRLPGSKRPPRGFAVDHKGSQWVVLPRDFCEWLAAAPLTRHVARYLGGRLLSDELIMQTLATNGPWADRIAPHYRREIVWPGPKLFDDGDTARLLASPAWFGRKFDAAAAPAPLLALARAHGFAIPAEG